MKLALVTSSAPFGRGEEFMLVEAGALANNGIEVFVVPAIKRQANMRGEKMLSAVKVLGCGAWSLKVLREFFAEVFIHPGRVMHALALAWAWHPSKLAKNLFVLPKGVWLARLGRRQRFDHIHACWASSAATVAMIASAVSGIPWSFTAHRGDIVDNNLLCRKLRRASFARFISAQSMQLASRVCNSQYGIQRILHLGVNLPHPTHAACTDTGKFIICCPANMVPVKGHRFLLDALATLQPHHEIELWLAGEGPLRPDLERQANCLGLGHAIRFLGQLRHDELLGLYAESRVQLVVLPSLDLGDGVHEGIPVSLMEAMSYGIPVISTKSGGIPELLEDGAGLMVPPANTNELASAISYLRDNPNLRHQLGETGQRRVAERFNLASTAKTLASWFKSAELHN
jgi:glycosyltransferase involved in cell wall biosynthesis